MSALYAKWTDPITGVKHCGDADAFKRALQAMQASKRSTMVSSVRWSLFPFAADQL